MSHSSDSNRSNSRLWGSDSQLQKIIDSALDAAITIDKTGHIIDWNRRAEQMFGWSQSEAQGKMLAELVIPQTLHSQHLDGLRRLKETGEGIVIDQKMELAALRRDGSEFPIELMVTQVEWNGNTIYNGFVRDVSERKEAEQLIAREKLETALLQQASYSSSVADALEDALRICVTNLGEISGWPVGHAYIRNQTGNRLVSSRIWYFSNNNNYRELQTASEQIALARGEDLPGQVWETGKAVWITNIEQDDSMIRRKEQTRLGVRSAFAFPIKIDDDVIAVVEFFNTKLVSPDQNLLTLARGVKDKIRQMIERMQWQEERTLLAAIVESSGDAIVGKAPDGTITSWNNGAEIIYGWKAEEVIGKTISIILPPGMAREESEILEAMKTGRRLEQFQTRRMRKDGTIVDVSITVSPIRGQDTQIIGSSNVERDITARRRREVELRKARDEAEKANRAQGEFLANVSHELRTPMNAILGMLELTLQENLTPVKRDYLETAKDSAEQLLLLVNDILDFSRLEAGRFELEPTDFYLRDLLDDVVKTLSLRGYEKGLELACHIKKDVPDRVVGDPVRLRQILTNLAGNAIKFTEQGEVVVSVKVVHPEGKERSKKSGEAETVDTSTTKAPGESVLLEFSVIDTGIGIAPEDQKRIFAPFAQADASTTRQYSGTGLGLAICHELIGLMNGEMKLESEVGRGSKFSFVVDLTIAESDDAELGREKATVDELQDLPVLVVDDNQTNRVILEEMLSNWSMSPTPVPTAQKAIEHLTEATEVKKQYPLVIVDALMPETDGFMLLEKAKEDGLLEAATILMLSSADHQIFSERCKDLDISAFLEKPVSQSDLLDAIMTALKGPHLERESVEQILEANQTYDVLVAEDTPANQKVITAVLKKRGHRCTIANNGREAVECLRTQDFDIVLMDVQMPTMDGLQATAMIRKNEQETGDHIPIIAMTAYAMRGDRDKCIAAGMDSYISKPINAKKLIRLLERNAKDSRRNRKTGLKRIPRELPRSQNNSGSEESLVLTSKSAEKEPVINMQAALKRTGDDRDILNDMVNYFFDDTSGLIQEVRKHVEAGDAGEAARAAHSLKGLCANFDAHAATQAAQAVETIGLAGDLTGVGDKVTLLEEELEQVSQALREWQEQVGA